MKENLEGAKGGEVTSSALTLSSQDKPALELVEKCQEFFETAKKAFLDGNLQNRVQTAISHNRVRTAIEKLTSDELGLISSIRDEEGNGLIHYVARSGSVIMLKSRIFTDLTINSKNERGNTPLHLLPFRHTSGEMDRDFIERGADVNAVNAEGNTPLHSALLNDRSLNAVIHLVSKSNLHLENNKGKTPYQILEQRARIAGLGRNLGEEFQNFLAREQRDEEWLRSFFESLALIDKKYQLEVQKPEVQKWKNHFYNIEEAVKANKPIIGVSDKSSLKLSEEIIEELSGLMSDNVKKDSHEYQRRIQAKELAAKRVELEREGDMSQAAAQPPKARERINWDESIRYKMVLPRIATESTSPKSASAVPLQSRSVDGRSPSN